MTPRPEPLIHPWTKADSVDLPLDRIPTPAMVIDRGLLARNLELLDSVQQRSGARVILALKGFAMFSLFPQIARVLKGTTASSLNEARLGSEEFGSEIHVYGVAYRDEEIAEICRIANHITFNSFGQWKRFRERALAAGVSCGIRINPEYAESEVDVYDPARPGSRFGMTRAHFEGEDLDGIEGLHFHTLFEEDADALQRTLRVVEEKFGDWLPRMRWLNMGGGHLITRKGYDIGLLCEEVQRIRGKYDLDVYLEPGEAVVLNAGFLVTSILDLFSSGGIEVAILDTSACAHMPDILEMPLRPEIVGAELPGEKAHTYRLGGLTCLSGDVIGDYSFDRPLEVGAKIVFTDMGHYTMVRSCFFNGIDLPVITAYDAGDDRLEIIRAFEYEDYKSRLS